MLDTPSMERAAAEHWERALASGSTLPAATFDLARKRYRRDVPWIMIMEAESARIWNEGPKDWRSALREYQSGAKRDAARIKAAIAELRRFDRHHAYLLRHAFQRALQDFMSAEKTRRVRRPNMNADRGYETVEVSGPRVRAREFQFLSKLSLFRFSELLDSWAAQVDEMFEPWPANWVEFGSLLFDRPVSPREAAKFKVARLGAIGHLLSRIRDATAGYGIRIYSTGQPIPTWGKPCWEIVAEFVNAAFPEDEPLTGDSVRRTWQSFTGKHPVRLQGWPKPAIAESQLA
jgi:hypothetical protein